MYRGFILELKDDKFSQYVQDGQVLHDKNKEAVKKTLNNFKDSNGKIVASNLVANWFPPVDADVFLSHSHKDHKLVMGLAGWLKREHGLTSFIDSCAWGYSGELQTLLDNAYCKKPGSDTFEYEKRNRVAAHVHMMLSVALAKMIDQCECIIFVNTPQSISVEDSIGRPGVATLSPWIYSEIAMTRVLRRIEPVFESANFQTSIGTEDFSVVFDLDVDHLTSVSTRQLEEWGRPSMTARKGPAALRRLYELCPE